MIRWLVVGTLLWLTLSRGAAACPWDNESYQAEAVSLPCVLDAVLGSYPKHSKAFYEARIRAADALLAWAPAHLEALDMKGIGLMKLGRLKQAEATMRRRAELAPMAYASHANLGTLYTFTGEWAKALSAIDQALAIEPRAHYGREKYHRLLVEFLRDVQADPKLAERENFLKLRLEPEQRLTGSPEAFVKADAEQQVFDALVSMITVYGAEGVSHVYVALGEALALHGERRLAWTAYQRAVELKHPRATELRSWQKSLSDALHAAYVRDRRAWLDSIPEFEGLPMPSSKHDPALMGDPNIYEPIRTTYQVFVKDDTDMKARAYIGKAAKYTAWEEKQVWSGLAVWREEGLAKLYAKANEFRPRCKSPGVILSQPLPPSVP